MTKGLTGTPLRRFWAWLTEPPDEILADAAREGELLVARLRVFITLLLTLAPLIGLLIDPDSAQNWIGLGIALTAVFIAALIAVALPRTAYTARISVVSAVTDVSLVSLGLLAFWLVGRPITTIIPPELHEEEEHILARVRSGERVDHFETVRLAKDGRRIPVSLMVSPVRDTAGRIIGISKIARDLSALQMANRELQALRDQLADEL